MKKMISQKNQNIEQVDKIQVCSNFIFIYSNINKGLSCYLTKNMKLCFEINAKIIYFLAVKKYLFIQYADKNIVEIFDYTGKSLLTIDRFPDLKNSFYNNQKIIIPTFDLLLNKKRYLTEINLDTLQIKESEWVWQNQISYKIIKLIIKSNFLIIEWHFKSKLGYIKFVEEDYKLERWSIPIKSLSPNFGGNPNDLNFYYSKFPEILFCSISNNIFRLNAKTGSLLWRHTKFNLSEIKNIHFYKKYAYLIPPLGNLIKLDLITGKEIFKIPNWLNQYNLPYNQRLTYKWKDFIKVYENQILISYLHCESNKREIVIFDSNSMEIVWRKKNETTSTFYEDAFFDSNKLFLKVNHKDNVRGTQLKSNYPQLNIYEVDL